jgi:hypothetical protein
MFCPCVVVVFICVTSTDVFWGGFPGLYFEHISVEIFIMWRKVCFLVLMFCNSSSRGSISTCCCRSSSSSSSRCVHYCIFLSLCS